MVSHAQDTAPGESLTFQGVDVIQAKQRLGLPQRQELFFKLIDSMQHFRSHYTIQGSQLQSKDSFTVQNYTGLGAKDSETVKLMASSVPVVVDFSTYTFDDLAAGIDMRDITSSTYMPPEKMHLTSHMWCFFEYCRCQCWV